MNKFTFLIVQQVNISFKLSLEKKHRTLSSSGLSQFKTVVQTSDFDVIQGDNSY